jgi:hypothetical protein
MVRRPFCLGGMYSVAGRSFLNAIVDHECARDYRGPHVMRIATTDALDDLDAPPASVPARAALIALCEYDVHHAKAAYDGDDVVYPWHEAMHARGFRTAFFLGPEPRSESGMAVAWHTSEFELWEDEVEFLASTANTTGLMCGTSVSGVSNVDLHERWHSKNGEPHTELEEMPLADRRHAGMVKLKHRATGHCVLLVVAHLMTGMTVASDDAVFSLVFHHHPPVLLSLFLLSATDSRDNAAITLYPGEVRISAFAALRRMTEQALATQPDIHAVLVTGDFNVNLTSGIESELPLLSGSIAPVADAGDLPPLRIDTGFQLTSSGHARLVWDGITLQEALEPVHRWGTAVGSSGVCSSFNVKRLSWIDQLWFSESSLRCTARTKNLTPAAPIPDATHASDHLPVAAVFEFL